MKGWRLDLTSPSNTSANRLAVRQRSLAASDQTAVELMWGTVSRALGNRHRSIARPSAQKQMSGGDKIDRENECRRQTL
jgi:hypothetical protein